MNSQPEVRGLFNLVLCLKLARWRHLIGALDFNELHFQLLTGVLLQYLFENGGTGVIGRGHWGLHKLDI